jgi:NTP-dependent ternary conflict system VMAP-like protein/trypsin-like peptidase
MRLQQWHARVEGGAGFLITPRHVMTCAHVVEGTEKPAVAFPCSPIVGEVPVHRVWRGDWVANSDNYGDVAVIELRDKVPIEPAPFARRDHRPFLGREQLAVYGFPSSDPQGVLAKCAAHPQLLIGGEWCQLDAWSSVGQALTLGYSGAAVAVARTGEVVGMVTAADDHDDKRLGRMLPLERLCEYWGPLRDLVPLGPFSPTVRRQLRHLLSDVPMTGLPRLYASLVNRMQAPALPPEVTNAYEVAVFLAEDMVSGNDFDDARTRKLVRSWCRLVANYVSDKATRDGVFEWLATQDNIDQPVAYLPSNNPPTGSPSFTSVIVHVAPSAAGQDRYMLTIWRLVDGGSDVQEYCGRLTPGKLRAVVEDQVPRIVDKIPAGLEVRVEFVLPRGWLVKPVDEWYADRAGKVRLGWRYPVVVRDLTRFASDSNDRELRRRVMVLHLGRVPTTEVLHRLPCRDRRTLSQLSAALSRGSHRAILVMASPPRPAARHRGLTAALATGFPAVCWPRTACADHDTPPRLRELDNRVNCAGERFCQTLEAEMAEFLRDNPANRLPELVRDLRARAAELDNQEAHCGRALTLMWDDPDRRPNTDRRLGLAD